LWWYGCAKNECPKDLPIVLRDREIHVRSIFVSCAQLLNVADYTNDCGIGVIVIENMNSLANWIFIWPVTLDKCPAHHDNARRIMRIAIIEATALKERNTDGAEVLRAGKIHNRFRFLSVLNRTHLRECKAGFTEISTERQPSNNSRRNHARNLLCVADHLAVKVPLCLDGRVFVAWHAIFCREKIP